MKTLKPYTGNGKVQMVRTIDDDHITQADLQDMGYTLRYTSYSRGYVSRKSTPKDRTAYYAGGSCKGMIYVYSPCWESTMYCYRAYYYLKD